jgi:hypothetical protein
MHEFLQRHAIDSISAQERASPVLLLFTNSATVRRRLARYRGVRQSPTWKKVEEAFWEKCQAVEI